MQSKENALVKWQWWEGGKKKTTEEKPVSVLFCPPHIWCGIAQVETNSILQGCLKQENISMVQGTNYTVWGLLKHQTSYRVQSFFKHENNPIM